MASRTPTLTLLSSSRWRDYELLDSGDGSKLERWGPYRFVRPEAQAIWRPRLPRDEWQRADATFNADDAEGGRWSYHRSVEAPWEMTYSGLRFWAQPTPFRHLGVFPEQADHWDWLGGLVREADRPVRVLNLFGYTGIASLAAARAGAAVTHVDASKKTIGWARDNQALSGLAERPIRWILDDALKFVRREARRGQTYQGFVVDPPPFGRGPKGEIWRIEQHLPELLDGCRRLFDERPLFFVLTAYAIRFSALGLYWVLDETMRGHGGTLEAGEAVLTERGTGRSLSAAIFARWSAEN